LLTERKEKENNNKKSGGRYQHIDAESLFERSHPTHRSWVVRALTSLGGSSVSWSWQFTFKSHRAASNN
jgi:hypothetical protein